MPKLPIVLSLQLREPKPDNSGSPEFDSKCY